MKTFKMRSFLLKWILGFDIFKWKANIELSQEIISSQVASLTEFISKTIPFTAEWPEVASKAIISLDDRVKILTDMIQNHNTVLKDLTKENDLSLYSWSKTKSTN